MRKFSIVSFLSLCLFLSAFLIAPASPAAASTSLTFPESWDIGQAFVIALSSTRPFEAPSVTWLERTIPLDVERGRKGYVSYALLGAHVRDITAGAFPLLVDFSQDGRDFRVRSEIQLIAREYPEEHLTVDRRMVTPPESEMARINNEARLATAARNTMTVRRQWTTPPYRPVPGIVTSPYGFRRFFNGVPRAPHAGADFRAAVGTPVRAPFAGDVILTGDHFFAGKSIYIDSGNGVISLFFHLSEIDVREGDHVRQGQVIGRTGATGRVTGPHLHLGFSLAGQYVDPVPLFYTSVTELLRNMRTEIVRHY